jgi:hypothetical protein
MAIDALGLPFDITWQRLAWSRDMLDRSYGGSLPPKWRSSLSVYIYPVPLADTVEEYPDHRIFYLKMTASVTGWSWREEIEGHLLAAPNGDVWQQQGWQAIAAAASSQTYWPCVGAILQVGIYPRPEAGVADDDYPFIVDFEPKKRELYEAVSETGEVLAGSSSNVNTRKGNTTTHSLEASVGYKPPLTGGPEASVKYGYERTSVDMETTDRSTERRETMGRSTQLAQMYQLFNGYHTGTNRAVFAMFPRPHTVSPGQQLEYSLIRGDRQLEGLQDVFLIVQVPRAIPGICVRGYIDTAHKGPSQYGNPSPVIVTRRNVGGCGTWDGDRLRSAPVPSDPPPRILVVGEYHVSLPPRTPHAGEPGHGGGAGPPPRPPKVLPFPMPDWPPQGDPNWPPRDDPQPIARTRRDSRVELADTLNATQSQIQEALLSNAASGAYTPVDFLSTETFRALAGEELSRSPLGLAQLEQLGHLTATERLALASKGITTVGQLFAASDSASHDKSTGADAVRAKLLRALTRRPSAVSSGSGDQGAEISPR